MFSNNCWEATQKAQELGPKSPYFIGLSVFGRPTQNSHFRSSTWGPQESEPVSFLVPGSHKPWQHLEINKQEWCGFGVPFFRLVISVNSLKRDKLQPATKTQTQNICLLITQVSLQILQRDLHSLSLCEHQSVLNVSSPDDHVRLKSANFWVQSEEGPFSDNSDSKW